MGHRSYSILARTLCAVVLVFVIDVSVLPQNQGHDMSKMPSASKPKPKTTVRKKNSRAGKRRAANPKKSTPDPSHEMHPDIQMPATSPSQTPKHETHSEVKTPVTTPSPPSSLKHEGHPGMNVPAASPSPSQSPKHETHSQTNVPAVSPSPDPTHETHQGMKMPDATPSRSPSSSHEMMPHMDRAKSPSGDARKEMGAMDMGSLMVMSGEDMSIRVGSSKTNVLPMGQMGSGTSWQPASTRMNMLHKTSGDWLLMFHYNAVVGVNSQGGPRGVTKFESANWFMPMAFRKVGGGTLELRGMFSLEPFTFPPGGSPLLFQTGESYKGRPIVDAQHPHDLFMELSASYTLPLGDRATWFTYFGYPGEPALGPTAFMHRASASENPSAPLSHHLQDSSHISFGVVTTGFTYRWFKLEGSVFNGREPGENRYNFEANPWNSRSARLSFAPNRNWSMQVSHGFLRNPEALEPGDVRRTTASISYNRPLEKGNWATTLLWGRNHENHGGETFNLNGYVAESTVNFLDKNYLYTRLELVDKNALLSEEDRLLLGITEHHPSFRIGAYSFGGARDIWTTEKMRVAIGGDVTWYSKPTTLDAIYGNNPTSYRLFLRFRPGKSTMAQVHDTH